MSILKINADEWDFEVEPPRNENKMNKTRTRTKITARTKLFKTSDGDTTCLGVKKWKSVPNKSGKSSQSQKLSIYSRKRSDDEAKSCSPLLSGYGQHRQAFYHYYAGWVICRVGTIFTRKMYAIHTQIVHPGDQRVQRLGWTSSMGWLRVVVMLENAHHEHYIRYCVCRYFIYSYYCWQQGNRGSITGEPSEPSEQHRNILEECKCIVP